MSVRAFPEKAGLQVIVSIWRRGDGAIKAVIESMPPVVIEETGTDVESRMKAVAEWMRAAAVDMDAQAVLMRAPPEDVVDTLARARECCAILAFPATDDPDYRANAREQARNAVEAIDALVEKPLARSAARDDFIDMRRLMVERVADLLAQGKAVDVTCNGEVLHTFYPPWPR